MVGRVEGPEISVMPHWLTVTSDPGGNVDNYRQELQVSLFILGILLWKSACDYFFLGESFITLR